MGRIAVVGAGKAGAGMAAAVEEVLGPRWLEAKAVTGWVNVPDDCVRKLVADPFARGPAGGRQRTHAGRRGGGRGDPADRPGAGAERSLPGADLRRRLGADARPGGGREPGRQAGDHPPPFGRGGQHRSSSTRSASSSAGIKGGGLWRACRAGRLAALIISDVLGDPLDVIASGPTVEDSSTPAAALAILERYQARAAGVPQAVFDYLAAKAGTHAARRGRPAGCRTW